MTQSIKNIISDRALPDYIREDYSKFVAFIKAYLEFIEQTKSTADIAKNLIDYRDIDNTIDEFITHFQNEYLINIPQNIAADKRLLAKHIKEFYLTKGNEDSYKFLFRILFNDNIDFYYPKTDILRPSDGLWYEQKSLKITRNSITTGTDIFAKKIVGVTSGAIAVIDSSLFITERGQSIIEVNLVDISGTFQIGEDVNIIVSESETYTETIIPAYGEIHIDNAGGRYALDDKFPLRDSAGTQVGSGIVTKVTNGPVTSITVIDGGTGYNGNTQIVTKFYALPEDYTFDGDYFPTTSVDGTGSVSGNDYTAYTFDQIITEQLISGTGDDVLISDSSEGFGYGASAIIDTVGNDHEILTVELIDGGTRYMNPTYDIDSDTGSGAELLIGGGGGTVVSAKVYQFPISLESDYDSNGETTVYPDFTDIGDGLAQGHLDTVSLEEYPGVYLNSNGQLSSNKKVQDSYYYQDYSYVIKCGTPFDQWKDIIKRIIHPAGIKMFGELQAISVSENNQITLEQLTVILEFISTSSDNYIAGEASVDIENLEYLLTLYSYLLDVDSIYILDVNGNYVRVLSESIPFADVDDNIFITQDDEYIFIGTS